MQIIDCHTHIWPDNVAARAVASLHDFAGVEPVAEPTRSGLVRHVEECGVDRAVVCPVSTKPEQVPGINDWVIGLNEPRLIPFGTLDPRCADVAGEVRKLRDQGVRGLKLQPFFQGYGFDSPEFAAMMKQISGRFVVLAHGGQEMVPVEGLVTTPAALARLVRDWPEVPFLFAHLGGFRLWDEVEEHLVGRRVWLDTSYTFGHCPPEQLERIVRAHGAEHIVLGSDFPWQSPRVAIEGVRGLGLSETETAAILGGNFERLLASVG